jgi:hypothetical protein
MIIPSNPSPLFKITENLPGTALNSENPNEKHCSNPAHKRWEQVQTKLETTQEEASKEHKIMS